MIQVQGRAPMLHLFEDLNVQALGWSDQRVRPSLDKALNSLAFKGAFSGGLDAETHITFGTPAMIRDQARTAMVTMGRRRLLISSGQHIPTIAPQSNLHAVRHAVE